MSSPPWINRKSRVRTPTIAAKADPEALRHRRQWQSSNGPTARAISNRTPPQRQLPAIISAVLSRSCLTRPALRWHTRRMISHVVPVLLALIAAPAAACTDPATLGIDLSRQAECDPLVP